MKENTLFHKELWGLSRSNILLSSLVEKIFNEVECDKAEANKICGTDGVAESNLLTYLGLIEARVQKVVKFMKKMRGVFSSDLGT